MPLLYNYVIVLNIDSFATYNFDFLDDKERNGMNLRELNTFLAIVRYGSFNKAAAALNYTPTSVTNQIHNLENDLGVVLFERGKSVRLTPVGRHLYEIGKDLSLLNQRVEDSVREFSEGIRGEVALGLTEPFLDVHGPRVAAGIAEAFPKIQLQIVGGYSEELGRKLQAGQLDLLVSEKRSYRDHVFSVHELHEMHYGLLIIPRGHRFEGRDSVCAAELNGERIMIGPKNSPWTDVFISSLREKGCTDFFPASFSQVQNVFPFIESGYMVAIMPMEMDVDYILNRYNVSTVRLSDMTSRRTLNLLTNEAHVPLSAAQGRVKEFILWYAEKLKADQHIRGDG